MSFRRALPDAPLATDLAAAAGMIPPLPGYSCDGRPTWPLLATQSPGEDAGAGDGTTGQGAVQPGQGAVQAGDSGGFVPPASQAEFDRMVKDRIARERGKYADYDDLKTKAAEYDKTVEAQKTEAQKLTDRAAAAERTAAETALRAMRAEVALDKGLTKSQAKRLVGSTLEELAADADDLLKDLGKAGGSGTTGATSFDAGARGTATASKAAAGLAEAQRRFPDKFATKT